MVRSRAAARDLRGRLTGSWPQSIDQEVRAGENLAQARAPGAISTNGRLEGLHILGPHFHKKGRSFSPCGCGCPQLLGGGPQIHAESQRAPALRTQSHLGQGHQSAPLTYVMHSLDLSAAHEFDNSPDLSARVLIVQVRQLATPAGLQPLRIEAPPHLRAETTDAIDVVAGFFEAEAATDAASATMPIPHMIGDGAIARPVELWL